MTTMPQPVARRGQVKIAYATPDIFRFAASLPSYHKFTDDNGLIFEATRNSIAAYNAAFPHDPILDADGTIASVNITIAPIKPQNRITTSPRPLLAHQSRAVDIVLTRPYFAFFHDMGTGKSATMATAAAELFARGDIKQALIISTKRGLPQLRDEQLPMWMPKSVFYRAEQITHAPSAKKFLYPKNDFLIGLATPGAFQSTTQTKMIKAFCEKAPTALFVDESQNFKGWSSERLKNLLKVTALPTVTRRYILSGEPQPKGLEDLFAQFYILDPNIIGHSTKESFENQYIVKGGFQLREIVDYRNKDELMTFISPYCEYIKITDVIDMPEQIHSVSVFEPTQQQRELYLRVKKELIAEVTLALNETDLEIVRRTCANAASKFTVLAQISNGFFYSDLKPGEEEGDARTIINITDERAQYMIENILNPKEKTIIFARFHQDLEIIKQALSEHNIAGVEFSGRISSSQAEANKLAFQKSSANSPTVFYATTASGGESLNLQIATHTIYYSNSYNYGHRVQSERRTWRTGQKNTCRYTDIIGFPVDRLILRNLREKQDTAEYTKAAVKMASMLEFI